MNTTNNHVTAIYDACVLYPTPKSIDEFLEILLRQGLTRSCGLLRQNI
jgi:hypothetical protein